MFPPFAGITYYCVRSYLAPRIASLYFVMLCLLRIYCFFPPSSSSVNPETGADATEYDYITDDPSPCTTELPDDGAQDPDATVDDDSFYIGGAYYYVQPADDDQE
ncbi:hypothetical protein ACQJBY_058342 [Aegilops geniculata]